MNKSQFYPINSDTNVFEHYSSVKPVIENFGFVSVSNSSNKSTSISETSSSTDIQTTNDTTNISNTDNSQYMESSVNTNTQVDSSQVVTTTNTTDNSSIQNINSSTDTYNVDNSTLVNETINETTTKIANTCGMSLEQAQAAVNIVQDESINTNIDASNTFMVTGNNNTISSVRLETELEYEGGEVQKNCVIDAATELENKLDAINENQKAQEGGTGGDVSTEAGGNTTDNTNETTKEDEVDAAVDAGQDALQAATTTNENTSENKNTNDITTEQTTKQTTEQKATAGGLSINLFIIMIIIFGLLLMSQQMVNLNKLINENTMIYLIIISLSLLNYLLSI